MPPSTTNTRLSSSKSSSHLRSSPSSSSSSSLFSPPRIVDTTGRPLSMVEVQVGTSRFPQAVPMSPLLNNAPSPSRTLHHNLSSPSLLSPSSHSKARVQDLTHIPSRLEQISAPAPPSLLTLATQLPTQNNRLRNITNSLSLLSESFADLITSLPGARLPQLLTRIHSAYTSLVQELLAHSRSVHDNFQQSLTQLLKDYHNMYGELYAKLLHMDERCRLLTSVSSSKDHVLAEGEKAVVALEREAAALRQLLSDNIRATALKIEREPHNDIGALQDLANDTRQSTFSLTELISQIEHQSRRSASALFQLDNLLEQGVEHMSDLEKETHDRDVNARLEGATIVHMNVEHATTTTTTTTTTGTTPSAAQSHRHQHTTQAQQHTASTPTASTGAHNNSHSSSSSSSSTPTSSSTSHHPTTANSMLSWPSSESPMPSRTASPLPPPHNGTNNNAMQQNRGNIRKLAPLTIQHGDVSHDKKVSHDHDSKGGVVDSSAAPSRWGHIRALTDAVVVEQRWTSSTQTDAAITGYINVIADDGGAEAAIMRREERRRRKELEKIKAQQLQQQQQQKAVSEEKESSDNQNNSVISPDETSSPASNVANTDSAHASSHSVDKASLSIDTQAAAAASDCSSPSNTPPLSPTASNMFEASSHMPHHLNGFFIPSHIRQFLTPLFHTLQADGSITTNHIKNIEVFTSPLKQKLKDRANNNSNTINTISNVDSDSKRPHAREKDSKASSMMTRRSPSPAASTNNSNSNTPRKQQQQQQQHASRAHTPVHGEHTVSSSPTLTSTSSSTSAISSLALATPAGRPASPSSRFQLLSWSLDIHACLITPVTRDVVAQIIIQLYRDSYNDACSLWDALLNYSIMTCGQLNDARKFIASFISTCMSHNTNIFFSSFLSFMSITNPISSDTLSVEELSLFQIGMVYFTTRTDACAPFDYKSVNGSTSTMPLGEYIPYYAGELFISDCLALYHACKIGSTINDLKDRIDTWLTVNKREPHAQQFTPCHHIKLFPFLLRISKEWKFYIRTVVESAIKKHDLFTSPSSASDSPLTLDNYRAFLRSVNSVVTEQLKTLQLTQIIMQLQGIIDVVLNSLNDVTVTQAAIVQIIELLRNHQFFKLNPVFNSTINNNSSHHVHNTSNNSNSNTNI